MGDLEPTNQERDYARFYTRALEIIGNYSGQTYVHHFCADDIATYLSDHGQGRIEDLTYDHNKLREELEANIRFYEQLTDASYSDADKNDADKNICLKKLSQEKIKNELEKKEKELEETVSSKVDPEKFFEYFNEALNPCAKSGRRILNSRPKIPPKPKLGSGSDVITTSTTTTSSTINKDVCESITKVLNEAKTYLNARANTLGKQNVKKEDKDKAIKEIKGSSDYSLKEIKKALGCDGSKASTGSAAPGSAVAGKDKERNELNGKIDVKINDINRQIENITSDPIEGVYSAISKAVNGIEIIGGVYNLLNDNIDKHKDPAIFTNIVDKLKEWWKLINFHFDEEKLKDKDPYQKSLELSIKELTRYQHLLRQSEETLERQNEYHFQLKEDHKGVEEKFKNQVLRVSESRNKIDDLDKKIDQLQANVDKKRVQLNAETDDTNRQQLTQELDDMAKNLEKILTERFGEGEVYMDEERKMSRLQEDLNFHLSRLADLQSNVSRTENAIGDIKKTIEALTTNITGFVNITIRPREQLKNMDEKYSQFWDKYIEVSGNYYFDKTDEEKIVRINQLLSDIIEAESNIADLEKLNSMNISDEAIKKNKDYIVWYEKDKGYIERLCNKLIHQLTFYKYIIGNFGIDSEDPDFPNDPYDKEHKRIKYAEFIARAEVDFPVNYYDPKPFSEKTMIIAKANWIYYFGQVRKHINMAKKSGNDDLLLKAFAGLHGWDINYADSFNDEPNRLSEFIKLDSTIINQKNGLDILRHVNISKHPILESIFNNIYAIYSVFGWKFDDDKFTYLGIIGYQGSKILTGSDAEKAIYTSILASKVLTRNIKSDTIKTYIEENKLDIEFLIPVKDRIFKPILMSMAENDPITIKNMITNHGNDLYDSLHDYIKRIGVTQFFRGHLVKMIGSNLIQQGDSFCIEDIKLTTKLYGQFKYLYDFNSLPSNTRFIDVNIFKNDSKILIWDDKNRKQKNENLFRYILENLKKQEPKIREYLSDEDMMKLRKSMDFIHLIIAGENDHEEEVKRHLSITREGKDMPMKKDIRPRIKITVHNRYKILPAIYVYYKYYNYRFNEADPSDTSSKNEMKINPSIDKNVVVLISSYKVKNIPYEKRASLPIVRQYHQIFQSTISHAICTTSPGLEITSDQNCDQASIGFLTQFMFTNHDPSKINNDTYREYLLNWIID